MYYDLPDDNQPPLLHQRRTLCYAVAAVSLVGALLLNLNPTTAQAWLFQSGAMPVTPIVRPASPVSTNMPMVLKSAASESVPQGAAPDQLATVLRNTGVASIAQLAPAMQAHAVETSAASEAGAPWPYLLACVALVLASTVTWLIFKSGRKEGLIVTPSVTRDNTDTETRKQITAAIFAEDKRPVILFDGTCNLCNGGVNFALDWDPVGNFRFAALQSTTGRALLETYGRNPDDISTIVLVDESACHIKSEAILRIGRGMSQGPWSAMSLVASFVPGFIRDLVYDQISRNRYSLFGDTQACRMSDEGFGDRFVSDPPALD